MDRNYIRRPHSVAEYAQLRQVLYELESELDSPQAVLYNANRQTIPQIREVLADIETRYPDFSILYHYGYTLEMRNQLFLGFLSLANLALIETLDWKEKLFDFLAPGAKSLQQVRTRYRDARAAAEMMNDIKRDELIAMMLGLDDHIKELVAEYATYKYPTLVRRLMAMGLIMVKKVFPTLLTYVDHDEMAKFLNIIPYPRSIVKASLRLGITCYLRQITPWTRVGSALIYECAKKQQIGVVRDIMENMVVPVINGEAEEGRRIIIKNTLKMLFEDSSCQDAARRILDILRARSYSLIDYLENVLWNKDNLAFLDRYCVDIRNDEVIMMYLGRLLLIKGKSKIINPLLTTDRSRDMMHLVIGGLVSSMMVTYVSTTTNEPQTHIGDSFRNLKFLKMELSPKFLSRMLLPCPEMILTFNVARFQKFLKFVAFFLVSWRVDQKDAVKAAICKRVCKKWPEPWRNSTLTFLSQ